MYVLKLGYSQGIYLSGQVLSVDLILYTRELARERKASLSVCMDSPEDCRRATCCGEHAVLTLVVSDGVSSE